MRWAMYESNGKGWPCRSQMDTPALDNPATSALFIMRAVRLGSRLTTMLAPFFIVLPMALPKRTVNSGVNSKFTKPEIAPAWNTSRCRRCPHTTLEESTTDSSMILPGQTRTPGLTATAVFRMESSDTTAPSPTRTLSLSTTFLQMIAPDTTEPSPM